MPDHNTPWPPAQDQIIRRWWPRDPDKCIGKLPDRTPAAIQRRACHLGVTRKQTSSHARWTDNENAVIESDYPTGGTHECAKRLPGRSRRAIKLQAARLGISYAGPIGMHYGL